MIAISQPVSPKGYPQRRRYKIPPDQIKYALAQLLEGKSLRSVARNYNIHHESLRERLARQYGEQYLKALKARGALSILNSYSTHPNARLRQAASDWTANNLDLLIELDLEEEAELLTEKQFSLSYKKHYSTCFYIEDSSLFSY